MLCMFEICTVDDFVLKNYLEFHDDLFPDTASDEPGLSATAWFSGANGQVMAEHKVSLLPWLHSINLKLVTNKVK